MNSVFNEQPSRRITVEFIEGAVMEAGQGYGVPFLNLFLKILKSVKFFYNLKNKKKFYENF